MRANDMHVKVLFDFSDLPKSLEIRSAAELHWLC